MGRRTDTKHDAIVALRLTASEKAELKAFSKLVDMPIAVIIRKLLCGYMNKLPRLSPGDIDELVKAVLKERKDKNAAE